MLAIPGMATARTPTETTVQCSSCGTTLCTLAAGEGVYPTGSAMRTRANTTNRNITCPNCQSQSQLPVTLADGV